MNKQFNIKYTLWKGLWKYVRKHVLYNHTLHIVLWAFFGIWLILHVLNWSAQTVNHFFPFNTFIGQHNNTTTVDFKYWGNSFSWLIARSGLIELNNPKTIYLTGDDNMAVSCSKQLEWMYYNTIRWAKLWPMDQNTLAQLATLDSDYNNMSVDWWFYTDCVWTSIGSSAVIWQITHREWWVDYNLFAWLHYDQSNNSFHQNQDLYGNTLVFQNGAFRGRIFDANAGWIGDLSDNVTPGSISLWGFSGAVFFPGISSVTNAEPSRLYSSNEFKVVGLERPTLMTVSSGVLLFIDNVEVWSTGIVNNHVPLKLEMFSSESYDTTVNTIIEVGGLTGVFSITTKPKQPDICFLTKEEKEKIELVFSWLLEQYGTASKLTALMSTMKSMIKDMQDFNYDCNLEYMHTLLDKHLEDIWVGSETEHIAPNCKKYKILYDENKQWYTSSNLKVKQYFASRQSLIRFIDSHNPWDCHIAVYGDDEDFWDLEDGFYAAPNGKVYEIAESAWIYSSPTMISKKEFWTRDALISFIDKNNPKIEIWDHKVDTTWAPITYAASNSKEYKIYKTDRGFMSYKLVKVQYFSTLEQILEYIEKNNKK